MKVQVLEFCHSQRTVVLCEDGRVIEAFAEIPSGERVKLRHIIHSITGIEWTLRLVDSIDLQVNSIYQIISNN